MKTEYISPALRVRILGTESLLANSIKVESTQKVQNTSDIGFVKEQSSGSYNVWDDDWSK